MVGFNMRNYLYEMLVVIFLLLVILMLGSTGEGRTITVDDDGPADHSTIQGAIDDADNGDIIRVRSGTYQENVEVHTFVSVIGDGSDVTTIDGAWNGDVVHITADDVTFNGFRVIRSGSGDDAAGISVESDVVSLAENNCTMNYYGISFVNANNSFISENQCSGNSHTGIHVRYSSDNTISNNNCSDNKYHGMQIWNADHITITQNHCRNHSSSGIGLFYSEYISVVNNTCSQSAHYGIMLGDSCNNSISSNTCEYNEDNGILLTWNSYFNQIENNTVMFNSEHGIFLSGDITYQCLNNSLINNSCTDNLNGIYIERCHNSIIVNNSCTENEENGMEIRSSDNNYLEANNCSFNDECGVYFYIGDNNIVWNNTFSNNWRQGIFFGFKALFNTLYENNCSSNRQQGISVQNNEEFVFSNNSCSHNGATGVQFHYGRNLTVENNSCTNNGDDGIGFRDSVSLQCTDNIFSYNQASGISFSGMDNSTISRNSCVDNEENGMELIGSCDNHFIGNRVSVNELNGIMMTGSYNNSILNNSVKWNSIGFSLNDGSDNNTFTGNNIQGNPEFGMDASDNHGMIVDASANWWGDATGPYHHENNTEGSGDTVSDHIEFEPWLTHPNPPPPTAIILSITPDPALNGECVTFRASGSQHSEIVRYFWRTDTLVLYDGKNDVFSHSDLPNGSHVVYLKVEDEMGIWSEEVNDTLIINGRPVVVRMDIVPQTGVEGDEITCSCLGSDDSTISTYSWRTAEKNLYYGSHAQFTITDLPPGTYPVFVKVMDDLGTWSLEKSSIVTVFSRPEAKTPTLSRSHAHEGEKIWFNGQGVYDGSVISYNWRSSIDGFLSSKKSFSLSNLSNGTHTIFFSVQDNNMIWSPEETATITINGLPRMKIVGIHPNPADHGTTIGFSATGSDDGNIVTYVWKSSLSGELYNGTSNTFHTDTLPPGSHEIILQAMDDSGGLSEPVNMTVLVLEKEEPVEEDNDMAFLLMGLLMGCIALIVLFIYVIPAFRENWSRSSGGISNEVWDVGEAEVYENENQDVYDRGEADVGVVLVESQERMVENGVKDVQESRNNNKGICPVCGSGINYLPPLNKWYCHVCKDFVSSENE